MRASSLGLFAGLLLGVAAAAGGFAGFVIALLLGILGFAVAGQLDGQFDFGALLRGGNRG